MMDSGTFEHLKCPPTPTVCCVGTCQLLTVVPCTEVTVAGSSLQCFLGKMWQSRLEERQRKGGGGKSREALTVPACSFKQNSCSKCVSWGHQLIKQLKAGMGNLWACADVPQSSVHGCRSTSCWKDVWEPGPVQAEFSKPKMCMNQTPLVLHSPRVIVLHPAHHTLSPWQQYKTQY